MKSFTKKIKPFDFHSKVKFDNWDIINEFKLKGFYNRSEFIAIVCEHLPEKDTAAGHKRLRNFWYSLVNDAHLNKELKEVLKNLKSK